MYLLFPALLYYYTTIRFECIRRISQDRSNDLAKSTEAFRVCRVLFADYFDNIFLDLDCI